MRFLRSFFAKALLMPSLRAGGLLSYLIDFYQCLFKFNFYPTALPIVKELFLEADDIVNVETRRVIAVAASVFLVDWPACRT